MIPVLVKMYKLLINELSNQLEAAIARREEDAEEEDDDDDVSGRKWCKIYENDDCLLAILLIMLLWVVPLSWEQRIL